MDDNMNDFLKEMKILLIKLEYEGSQDEKMDLVDRIFYTSRNFRKEFCD
ncbi:hypothetical protein JR311_19730 (plasmid) [Bacillus velezensis]|nr:hypothetical protein [Bacillus velezensis]QRV11413.1 hypothetical protein JR311_20545 [Bacillus velezensis]QRV11441.1 hypothetical protein JR311_19730 [Bacillus velezensis]URJ76315.1 hypothetical protein MF619_004059 [Bacillus velezensis]URJ80435.1 hypothetical protein MF621_004021 [Bacillus velezensis]